MISYRPVVLSSVLAAVASVLPVQALSQSAPSPVHTKRAAGKATGDASLDPGTVANNLYRNKTLAFTCQVPQGWVLRTDELDSHDDASSPPPENASPQSASSAGSRVLLAAFSRPPEAKGEEVNSSILIAAESVGAYPGLTEPIQYLGTLTEVAKAQGFILEDDPYEIAIDTQKLVRADSHKDVGTRVMHQSTLAMLSHGYAISITLIAGTEDDVEDLVNGLTFTAAAPGKK